MTVGIYCIENTTNNKKYVGQSVNIEERLKTHKRLLNKKDYKEENQYLIMSWIKYGSEVFTMYIIEECDKRNLDEKERFYIKYFDCKAPKGYNLTDGGNKPPSPKGKPKSEQWKINQRKAKLGHVVSDETRRKISNAGLNRTVSSQTRKKMSLSACGRKGNLNNKTSSYVGVCLDKRNGKWRATAQRKFLGYFNNEHEAATRYDEHIHAILKDKSKLNFPERFR